METGSTLPGAAAEKPHDDVVVPRGADASADKPASKEKEKPEVVRPRGRKGKQPPKLFWIIVSMENDDPIEGSFNGKFFAIPPNKRILVTQGVITALTLAEKTRMKRKRSFDNAEDLPDMESASQFEEIRRPAYPTLQAAEATPSEVEEALDKEQIRIYSLRDNR